MTFSTLRLFFISLFFYALLNDLNGQTSPAPGEVQQALDNFERAKKLTRSGDYDLALPLLEQSFEVCKQTNVPPCTLAQISFELADAQGSLGFIEKALDNFRYSLDQRLKHCASSSGEELARAYSAVAQVYSDLGLSGEGIEYYTRALAVVTTTFGEKSKETSLALQKLGWAYYLHQDTVNALYNYQQALKIQINLTGESNVLQLAKIYNNFGRIALQRSDLNEAMKWFQTAKTTYESVLAPDHVLMAIPYINIGIVLKNRREFDQALAHYMKGLQIRKNKLAPDDPDLATPYKNIADLYMLSGDYAKAVCYYDTTVLNLAASFPMEHIYITETLEDKADAYFAWYEKTKNPEHLRQAVEVYKKTWELTLLQQKNTRNARSKQLFIANLFSVCEGNIRSGFARPDMDAEELWTYFEHSKAYLLLEGIQDNTALHFAGLPDSLLQKDHALREKIGAQQKKIYFLKGKKMKPDEAPYLEAQAVLFDLQKNYEQLIAGFENAYPDYFRLKFNVGVSKLSEIQSTLTGDQTLLEYFVGDSSIFVFVVQNNSRRVVSIPLDFDLKDWVKKCLEGINGYYTATDKPKGLYEKTVLQYAQYGHDLYTKLVEPVAGFLKKEVIIIPDGPLNNLPFEVLLSNAPRNARNFSTYPFLLHEHVFHYCYSATMLRQMSTKTHRQTPQGHLLAVAPFFTGDSLPVVDTSFLPLVLRKGLDPLPYSGEEIARAKAWSGDPSLVLIGKAATRQRFLEEAGKYKILHLATHGKADEADGDFSFLALALVSPNEDENFLYGKELYNLTINADLVLLSACQTGIGEKRRGEGIFSLSRAFAFAGAKSIMTSLWNVNDHATMQIMDVFYRELGNGVSKNMALTTAKRSYLQKNPANAAHPFFWGGMIAIGDMRPMNLK